VRAVFEDFELDEAVYQLQHGDEGAASVRALISVTPLAPTRRALMAGGDEAQHRCIRQTHESRFPVNRPPARCVIEHR
jgi:hypothetical protein